MSSTHGSSDNPSVVVLDDGRRRYVAARRRDDARDLELDRRQVALDGDHVVTVDGSTRRGEVRTNERLEEVTIA